MTFEEEFPEFADTIIQGRYIPYVVADRALQKYKERVREVLFPENGFPTDQVFAERHRIKKELGL